MSGTSPTIIPRMCGDHPSTDITRRFSTPESILASAGIPVSISDCTSAVGEAGVGLANVNYYLDSNRNFHVGTTAQFIAASTNGQAVGNVPALKTTDHWTNITFEFGFSF